MNDDGTKSVDKEWYYFSYGEKGIFLSLVLFLLFTFSTDIESYFFCRWRTTISFPKNYHWFFIFSNYYSILILLVPVNDDLFTPKLSNSIAIDWNYDLNQMKYNQNNTTWFEENKSVKEHWDELNLPISLEQCIKWYTQKEILGDDDGVYCGKCQASVKATKMMEVYTLPNFLILHLKRFVLYNNNWMKSNRFFFLLYFTPFWQFFSSKVQTHNSFFRIITSFSILIHFNLLLSFFIFKNYF